MKSKSLSLLMKRAPGAWSLVRAVECDLLIPIKFKRPIVDLGCGDGFFAQVLFQLKKEKKCEYGVDFDPKEIKRAKKIGIYNKTYVADIANLPFKNDSIETFFSNGTLEHTDDIDACLKEISRVLKKGGKLIFTVPTIYVGKYLSLYKFLGYVRLKRMAHDYEYQFNKIFKHKNLFTHKLWQQKLQRNSLEVERYDYYNLDNIMTIHDVGCVLALPNYINKYIFGKWVVIQALKNVINRLEIPILDHFFTLETSKKRGPSLLIIATKQ